MNELFVDPYTKQALDKDSEGNLYCSQEDGSRLYKCYDGCFDFVVAKQNIKVARECYDDIYSKTDISGLTLAEVTEYWQDDTVPWRKTMIDSLGELSGSKILLIGNGTSYREFYFLHLGARVVFTDLSLEAVRRAQDVFRRSELWEKHRDDIEFHAVDAMHLPFSDGTFDIIYGSKFLGFLENIPQFFSEASRCLKPNGICRFSDDAYSPLWEYTKRRLLRPIQKWIFRSPTSLDQLRSEAISGFKQQDLFPFMEQCEFRRVLFIREYFFLRLAQLCYGKLVRWNPKHLRRSRPLYLIMKWFDICLGKAIWIRKNYLALTWGFDK